MKEKEKELLKAREEIVAKLKEIGQQPGIKSTELAKLINEPYDPEKPIADVISSIFTVESVDVGEDFDYFVVDEKVKTVYSVVNGSVTQTAVTPLTENSLTFSPYNSPEYYVYVEKLLRGKYSILANARATLTEALDRLEQYHALQCIDNAVPVANQLNISTGKTKVDFPEIIRMVRTIAKYATPGKLVLITGSQITEDILLMDYEADKNREVTLEKAGISKWIAVEAQQVTIDGSAKNIIEPNVAYLVADSDVKDKRAGYFVRQRVNGLDGAGAKERITISSGILTNVGSARKMAISVLGFEMFGCVVVNSKVLVKLTK